MSKTVKLLYGKTGMNVTVPDSAVVLEGQDIPAMPNPDAAVLEALDRPIGSAALAELVRAKRPKAVAITISDITRPVPNKVFLPPILKVLNDCGVADKQIVIIVGTGMHRHSTLEELEILVGKDILSRVEVIDHDAHDPATLKQVSQDPPVSVCRRFADADFRIVTGYIEAHFMAGFSGGRKGVCPALVDLKTVQRFHGYRTLSNCAADTGVLAGNPCHEISLQIAKIVGVDFLFNVAITRDRKLAGIYCGDLEKAHAAGCEQVAAWTTAPIDKAFDLVITNAGGYPLDATFYQTVKGMCGALPALGNHSTMLLASECSEQWGSAACRDIMQKYGSDWQRFLLDIAQTTDTKLDQWQYQMQARVLERIGVQRLWFVSDGLPLEAQRMAGVNPIVCEGNCGQRMQMAIDQFVADNPDASIAVIPDGPYTLVKRA